MTKTDKIKAYMRKGNTLTHRKCQKLFNYDRLSDLIHVWSKKGAFFCREWVYSKESKAMSYRLISEDVKQREYKSDLSRLRYFR